MFISECGDGACAAEPLWCCPALLSAHEAVIWIRTNPKTCCSGFAPASPAHRLSLTLHQLATHSPLCVCVFVCMCCGCVDALCCCLKKIQSLLWNRVVSSLEATVCRPEQAVSHGGAPLTGNGRCGGFGQPARLDPGTSDLQEVVQSWADTMQTLFGSVVWDWKMLPGTSTY